MPRRFKRGRLGHDRGAALINQRLLDRDPDETCRFCGYRGPDACDALPPDTCERAIAGRPTGKPDAEIGKPGQTE